MYDISFMDWRSDIERSLIKGNWVLVYNKQQNQYEDYWICSALVPNERIKETLNSDNWDIFLGQGYPDFGSSAPDFKPKYLRFGNFENIEPLVYYRTFYDVKKTYLELSQEFIHYYNLYYDLDNRKYIKVLKDGNEEDVVIIKNDLIKVKLKYLKEYLAIKESHLAIYFDLKRFTERSFTELGLKLENQQIKGDNFIYFIDLADSGIYGLTKNRNAKSSSRFYGKVLISGKKDFVPDMWGRNKEFQEFIVGIDKNGSEIFLACDSFKLGPNKFILPVFFKREVLKKYYDNPEKYTVGDNYINCISFWNLSIDNNHEKYIVVLLGDLGKTLSNKEQMHWKHFNLPPEGGLSDISYRRSFQCEFLPPVRSDLLFKEKYRTFNALWAKKFSWSLFMPLHEGDIHYFKRLRIPLSESSSEFEELTLCLTKIIIDSLNEKELEKQTLSPNVENSQGGITKLEIFLDSHKIRSYKTHIFFLRDLQALRSSSVVHRKGKNFEKIAKTFKIYERNTIEIFDDILRKALKFLEYLEESFLIAGVD